MKNLTLFFENLSEEHLGKDPILVPYYLGKKLGYSVTIIYPRTNENNNLPATYKGMSLVPIELATQPKIFIFDGKYMNFFKYIWKHAKEIDVFMRFFHCELTEVTSFIYKFRNPKGKIYVKMDKGPINILSVNKEKKSLTKLLMHILRDYIDNAYKRKVDLISCESTNVYNMMQQTDKNWFKWGSNLCIMQNGFDEELLQSLQIRENAYSEKDNIMITVARLGTTQKNTPMILEALSKVDLRNWKFYFVGPIELSFDSEIDLFFQEHPDKKNKVIFTGPIYNKRELWEYYNKSKVFVLTSRWESSGLVLYEAKRFRNFILSTSVGAIDDVIENGKYGKIIEQENSSALAAQLQAIIDGYYSISNIYSNYDSSDLSWDSVLTPVSKRLSER